MTEPLKEYIETKMGSLEKFVSRYDVDGSLRMDVEISRTTASQHKGEVFYAEASVQLPGKLVRAEDTQADARVAIDSVKQILKQELVKYKEKSLNSH